MHKSKSSFSLKEKELFDLWATFNYFLSRKRDFGFYFLSPVLNSQNMGLKVLTTSFLFIWERAGS
jgi:hypothetical protein